MTKQNIIIALLFLLIALIIWIFWGNQALVVSTYSIASEKLQSGFDGFYIAHVSDLHNAQMGRDNKKLLALLREADPDIIAITGDMIDSRRTDIEVALQFAEEAVKIAPCYYVTGNHEARVVEYNLLKKQLKDLGVTVLEDASLMLEYQNDVIALIGVDDPSFQTKYLFGDSASVMDDKLRDLVSDDDGFRLLLSHRPELFQVYADNGIDLVLSGHAHGGQFRLPLIGGLYAPNQGFFPKYDAGLYIADETHMIVSRGIGNSLLPFRINNRPELVLIELKTIKTSD